MQDRDRDRAWREMPNFPFLRRKLLAIWTGWLRGKKLSEAQAGGMKNKEEEEREERSREVLRKSCVR